ALVLVEIVTALRLERRTEVSLTVIACFSIGLGAALTPIGEPLSTIAISKLGGEPYHAGFFYLVDLLGPYIVPGVLALGVGSLFLLGRLQWGERGLEDRARERQGLRQVFIRAVRVYIFVMALIVLGTGFRPIIDWYFVKVPPELLFWANTSSAILDNATLAAAEIGPALSTLQIKSALVALLVAGGMLIPGNIPNIISAQRLRIGSREWARIGVPLGAVLMVVYFLVLYLPVWLGD
ncbi:MAG: DUF1646 family protein, partial [Chloroflexota bacterium]|nr:DUF1646 family protein [Chloroflexota bacterium]